jgi:hypothetical protein
MATISSVPSISTILGGLNAASDQELRPMKTGKAKGLGMEYTWVEIGRTEHTPKDINEQAQTWCQEKFSRPGVRWFEKKDKFYFKNDRDLTLFLLRWS